jgi:nitroreductase
MDLFEAIYTTRAMRRLKPDPIPDDVLRSILNAAIRAPSGGNSQGWSFLVVRDAGLRAQIAALWKPLAEGLFAPGSRYQRLLESDDAAVASQTRRMLNSVQHLADHMGDAPVLVFACLETGGRPTEITAGSSIYPAVQNLMLAARAHGVGTTLTTIHRLKQDEVRTLLDIPATVETAALIPMGYPTGRWGVAKRRPLNEVAFLDRWGRSM